MELVLVMKVALNVGIVTVVILGAIALYAVFTGNPIQEIGFGKDQKIKFGEKKPTIVNPKMPGNEPISEEFIKEGASVQVVPARDFEWACKGQTTEQYNLVGPGGDNRYSSEGLMLPSAPFCSLIGRVGEGQWHNLGANSTFTSDRSGKLYLTANDRPPETCELDNKSECYSDNIGTDSASVTVKVNN
ncbi:MAG: hypothetical protein NW220_01360 [Leptolyngbyaceae cyanobacterium bins.349]|nr:hypothetical protein [Leptolyngbyaceae cyanobacterium bins.349]